MGIAFAHRIAMLDHVLISCNIPEISREHFYRAINIYIFKPHVVNRKLFGINNLLSIAYRKTDEKKLDPAEYLKEFKLQYMMQRKCDEITTILGHKYKLQINPNVSKTIELERYSEENGTGYLILNRLLPRNLNVFQPLDMLAMIDFDSQSVCFVCLQDEQNNLTPKIIFSVELCMQKLSIKCSSTHSDEKSMIWLKEILFHRLVKWINALIKKGNTASTKEEIGSLSLIDNLEAYNQLYSTLKTKYGTEMVRIWPETTDPKKFVYEDIAIATYLLLLWKQEREATDTDQLQSFVDVGCGNGLLVYILTSEGHNGFGLDLRKRKIWDLYPKNVSLKAEPLVPSDDALFPKTDWIIGNHSDELSPWIPVLAAKSSYRCRYFLLPCCAFEFDGSKFQRKNSSVSQYSDFLSYVRQISDICGFRTAIDRLKIPSTKRTCIIGSERTYAENQFATYCKNIQIFIDSRNNTVRETDGNWSADFKPRESVEKVRNCTKIDRNIIEEIVRIVFEALIAKKRIATEFPDKQWNAGGILAIGELVNLITQDKLNCLKSECGGLQTLLKNNHQIFQVLNGNVQLRIPTRRGESSKTAEEMQKRVKKQKNPRVVELKERLCWFYCNHPDGCPLEEKDCKFKH
ncbi:probable tRNA (uracil-O(2)-)-methyltransferase [Topomyia yanbarensis]|uniref:probable tRNA (uracil-O(2)-)-methyltransferase n=1 Tax=Topomyia yanbarensis TaxID=2498891 RepID=UPI00273CB0A5|nr:probable tRNA (uracil-O(2)-)-methyltransferase [Topomyia yanbarensis]